MAWDREGRLLCGETDRGWGSLGGKTMGLQRLAWTGEVPFEVREMHATPRGFELEARQTAAALEKAAMVRHARITN